MYGPTKFKATLWHPKDGIRRVSVQVAAGAKPFGEMPDEIGLQLLVCEAEDTDEADSKDGDKVPKPLAMLYLDREEASKFGSEAGRHATFAQKLREHMGRMP